MGAAMPRGRVRAPARWVNAAGIFFKDKTENAMNINEAIKLQSKWGDRPCEHPDIIAEAGTLQDKWRCVECGRLVDFDEWELAHGRSDAVVGGHWSANP